MYWYLSDRVERGVRRGVVCFARDVWSSKGDCHRMLLMLAELPEAVELLLARLATSSYAGDGSSMDRFTLSW